MCCIRRVSSSPRGAKSRTSDSASSKNASKENEVLDSRIENTGKSCGSTIGKIFWLLSAWLIACVVRENYSLWLLNTVVLSAILADGLLWYHNSTGDRFILTKGAVCIAAFTLLDECTVLLEDEYTYGLVILVVGFGSWLRWTLAERRRERMRIADMKIKKLKRKFRVKARGIKVSIRSLEMKS